MAANSLLASAAQALCVIAWRGAEGATSEMLARSLDTNPVVVRRLLKALEREGLVRLRPGRHGGVALVRPPDAITLQDIYRAIDPTKELFVLRARRNPRCAVQKAMVSALPPVFAAANQAVDGVLARTTLAALLEEVQP